MSSIKSHFDNISINYSERSNRGLWKFVRSNESRIILSMLPKITDTTTALDLGCGSGFYSDILWRSGIKNITCVDFSEKMLQQIKNPKYKKIAANIEEFNNNQKYDIILCAGALEFIENPHKVFKNISTMLNKTGCFILLYPLRSALGFFYQYYHRQNGFSVNLYSDLDIKIFGKNCGFNFFEFKYAFPFSKIIKQKLYE